MDTKVYMLLQTFLKKDRCCYRLFLMFISKYTKTAIVEEPANTDQCVFIVGGFYDFCSVMVFQQTEARVGEAL